MNLILQRNTFTDKSTIGELLVDDDFFCYTLEDVVRPTKINGETAIPFGQYEVIVNFSNRFQRRMPLLLDVPYFTGIRIHPGNDKDNTEGCILVGESKEKDWIGDSRNAFNALFPIIDKAAAAGKVFITILERR